MRMTDLMSGAALALFPTIGLILFGLIFLALTIRVLRTPSADARRHGSLPLEEGATTSNTTHTPERSDV